MILPKSRSLSRFFVQVQIVVVKERVALLTAMMS